MRFFKLLALIFTVLSLPSLALAAQSQTVKSYTTAKKAKSGGGESHGWK